MAIATNNVHYATPARRPLATALAAVRARRSLDEVDPWLPAASLAHLRSGAEQARHMARYPGVVEAAAALGRAIAFDLSLVAPSLPPYPVPGRARRDGVPAPAGRGWSPPPLRRSPRAPACVVGHRSRARCDRAPRVPRLLPRGVGHRRLLPPVRHLLPGSGERGEQCGLLRARHHQGRCGGIGAAVRALPVATARRAARHRHRHRDRTAARRSSSTCTTATAGTTRRKWRT